MTTFPPVTLADWRAQVDKELAGRSFEKALVHETIEGLSISPLYTEAPKVARDLGAGPFRICMRSANADDAAVELEGGADASWLPIDARFAGLASRAAPAFLVLEPGELSPSDAIDRVVEELGLAKAKAASFLLACDPLGRRAGHLADLGRAARRLAEEFPHARGALISTLPYHDAGADAADEIAIALSSGARTLQALLDAGLSVERAARQIALQIAVGRDTFLELSKVRALRACWRKLLVASGVANAERPIVHAVCSSRTMAARDPWVNMLRVTTQVFSAVLGGADLVTPASFDQLSGQPSPHGRRVARNTGVVLREESFLGRVVDPAGGSYYLDTLTDALAREAWRRFRTLEGEGGVLQAIETGRLAAKLEASWQVRLESITKRKTPILGVSEFANLEERVPFAAAPAPTPAPGTLAVHRDAEAFEALRARADRYAEEKGRPPEALLLTLGSLAESRPRVGFAAGFFAAGGIRSRETTADDAAAIVCLCGTDERYASEAAARIRALKAAGAGRVLVAGRPGALEAPLREAGADGFIYVGCDVVATLSDLLDDAS